MLLHILISAILGGALGAALWGVEHFSFSKAAPKTRQSLRGVIALVTVISINAVVHSSLPATIEGWFSKAPTTNTVATSTDPLTTQMLADPTLAAEFQGMTPAAASAKGQQLSSQGIARLDDTTLRTRASILSTVLGSVSQPTCSAIAKGTTTPAQQAELLTAIAGLPQQQRDEWYSLSIAAMKATLAQTPAIPANQNAVPAAMQTLKAALNASDAASVDALLAGTATDEEACTGVRALYVGALIIPESQGSVLIRAMVST